MAIFSTIALYETQWDTLVRSDTELMDVSNCSYSNLKFNISLHKYATQIG